MLHSVIMPLFRNHLFSFKKQSLNYGNELKSSRFESGFVRFWILDSRTTRLRDLHVFDFFRWSEATQSQGNGIVETGKCTSNNCSFFFFWPNSGLFKLWRWFHMGPWFFGIGSILKWSLLFSSDDFSFGGPPTLNQLGSLFHFNISFFIRIIIFNFFFIRFL